MTDVTHILKNNPSFSEFDLPELQIISESLILRQYSNGHFFVKEGDKSCSFYILLEGVVAILRNKNGSSERIIVENLRPGALIGLVSILDQGPRSASCRAEGNITVAECSVANYEKLCEKSDVLFSKFQFAMAKQLANDMRKYNQVIRRAVVYKEEITLNHLIRAAEYRGIDRRDKDRRTVGRRKAW